MTKYEMNDLLFELKLERSKGCISPFVLCADGKLMGTLEAIEWLEKKLGE